MLSKDFRVEDGETGLMVIGKTRATTNPSRHFHDSWEILYIVEGERTFFHSSRTFNVQAGDMLIVRPGVLHRALNKSREFCELLNIYFNDPCGDLFKRILPVLESCGTVDNPVVSIPGSERFRIAKTIMDIATELSIQERGYREMAWGLLFQMLVEIARFAVPASPEGRIAMNARMGELIDYLNLHFREDVSLARTAKVFGWSESSLSRAFHQSIRFTFTEYLATLRVREACRLLLSTDKSVSDISEWCGFGSMTQFGRIFKRITGESPLVWKKRSSRGEP